MHEKRPKCSKQRVDYFDMNVGHSPQKPKQKTRWKKLDIVSTFHEPSETRVALHRIQEDHHKTSTVIGTTIKSEIESTVKSDIKSEYKKVNTHHKYKGTHTVNWSTPNYIHPDGIPCSK